MVSKSRNKGTVLCKWEFSICQQGGGFRGSQFWAGRCNQVSVGLAVGCLMLAPEQICGTWACRSAGDQTDFTRWGYRGAPLEQELACAIGRNYWYLGETEKLKALCGWITHIAKTRAFLFLYCLMFVKSTGQLQSSHLCISGRHVGSSGNAAKLEFMNGQTFGWIKSLLAFLYWRTSLWMVICWQESGERRCFSHTSFSHENKSIHYWLFTILPSNKLSAIQAAAEAAKCCFV